MIDRENVVAILDRALVARKSRAPDVWRAFPIIKPIGERHPRHVRPLALFARSGLGERFDTKRMCLKYGASLSRRSGHVAWGIRAMLGAVGITLDDAAAPLTGHGLIYSPKGPVGPMARPWERPPTNISVRICAPLITNGIILDH